MTRKLKRKNGSTDARMMALEARTLLSVSPVKDINASQAISAGYWGGVDVGSIAYLSQDDAVHGQELWKTDGTTAGTVLVKDINPGEQPSSPGYLTALGSLVLFAADDGTNGVELWKSDGSAGGTVMVKDINPGSGASYPSNLVLVNNTVYFAATDGTNGTELWKSDGTTAGTVMVKDIAGGSTGSSPNYLINNNGTLLFSANDVTHGTELWKSDGTNAGTAMVTDLNTGSTNSSPRYLTAMNGIVYFAALSTGQSQPFLWKSDGTSAGTALVSGSSTPFPQYLTKSGNLVYFDPVNSTSSGLWRTDGTAAGTFRVTASGASGTDVNGTLYFASGTTLYSTTGTTATTVKTGLSSPTYFANVNGTLYFDADGGNGAGAELWKSNGTAGTTTMVKDIAGGATSSSPYGILPVGAAGHFLFAAIDPTLGGALYISDGTSAGTTLLKDIDSLTMSSGPFGMVNFNGAIYFTASDGVTGTQIDGELYKTDGTAGGTSLVTDIWPGAQGSHPDDLMPWNGRLYFRAGDPTNGYEIWSSDGTAGGTTLLKNIAPGSAGSLPNTSPETFFASGNYLYFVATDGSTGEELWRTDGTAAGTIRLTDIVAGSGNTSPDYMTDVNGTLYFTPYSGNGLWTTDGTVAGTVAVRSDLNDVNNLCNVNGTLFFAAYFGNDGTELWKSDGSAVGTVEVNNIGSSFNSSNPASLTNLNGTLFFAATDGTHGIELWRSDGTAAGTAMVMDIKAGSAASSPASLTNVNGVLYFAADDGVHGAELWRSDGSAAGTYLVKDIEEGSSGSALRNFAAINGFLYFTADNGAGRLEPWRSDGTTAGTVQLADIQPGAALQSSAFGYAGLNGDVYFSATDGIVGRELWKADAPTFASVDSNHVLTITGTANNDVIAIGLAPTFNLIPEVILNGITVPFPNSNWINIKLEGAGGADSLAIDYSNGLVISNDLGGQDPNLTLQLNGVNTEHFTTSQHLAALKVLSSHAIFDANGANLLDVGALSVTSGGSIDLSNNSLIVDYSPAAGSPIGSWNGTNYDGVTGLIRSGRANGNWNGTGLITSMSAAKSPSMLTTLGVAEASQVLHLSGAQTALWKDQAVDASSVLVKYTYAGDANLDGKIDADDYFRIDSNDNKTGDSAKSYFDGDFNYDGRIDGDDYFLIDSNFHAQGAALAKPLAVNSRGAGAGESPAAYVPPSRVAAFDANESAYRRLIDDAGDSLV